MSENTTVLDGVQAFYARYAEEMQELGGPAWPVWSELSAEQENAWGLTYAATVEVSFRIKQALEAMS